MKTLTLILFFAMSSFYTKAQITDSEIAHTLLGKRDFKIKQVLDSLKVWYHFHNVEDANRDQRWLSIADGDGVVKVYRLFLERLPDGRGLGFYVAKLSINYRHDSKEQVEKMNKVMDASDLHIGYYSTDLFFKLKR